jgi:hypothetical protein
VSKIDDELHELYSREHETNLKRIIGGIIFLIGGFFFHSLLTSNHNIDGLSLGISLALMGVGILIAWFGMSRNS